MAAALLRFSGFDEFRQHAETNPPSRERRQARERVGGECTPLSVRMHWGNPYSLNNRVNTGFAPATAVEYSA